MKSAAFNHYIWIEIKSAARAVRKITKRISYYFWKKIRKKKYFNNNCKISNRIRMYVWWLCVKMNVRARMKSSTPHVQKSSWFHTFLAKIIAKTDGILFVFNENFGIKTKYYSKKKTEFTYKIAPNCAKKKIMFIYSFGNFHTAHTLDSAFILYPFCEMRCLLVVLYTDVVEYTWRTMHIEMRRCTYGVKMI